MNDSQPSNPVIICLHGGASSAAMWGALRQAVRKRARVVTPELSGLGPYALSDDVRTVLRFVTDLRRPIHLVTHGRGAAVAACIANLYPDRVASIVMYEPAGVTAKLARGIRAPVQVLCGTRSWRVAQGVAERLVNWLAEGRLLKLFGLRHMAPVTRPHFVNPVILDFVLPVEMAGQPVAA